MLIFVVFVLVISNWHANWNAQYMLFVIAEYLFNWARAHEPSSKYSFGIPLFSL